MIKRPDKCCKLGNYECQVPMAIKRRIEYIDLCIAPIVAALNAANIITDCSCCGHGDQDGLISLVDGRQISISKFPKEVKHEEI